MGTYIGVDVGAVGAKAAVIQPLSDPATLTPPAGVLRPLATPQDAPYRVWVAPYRRTRGRPLEAVRAILAALLDVVPQEQTIALALTGTGSRLVAEALQASTCNEFQACVRAVDLLHPDVRTILEIGGENSRYIRVEPDPASGRLGILDYSNNGDCAAGTGAFLDQQAGRLKYDVKDIGSIVDEAERAAQIAGRCSVFAKSDMIHAQQKGFLPAEVLRGLCNAVATNYKSAVVRGRTPQPPVMLLGGVSANTAVVRSLREVFNLQDGQLCVPDAAESLPAVGAALSAADADNAGNGNLREQLARLATDDDNREDRFPRTRPLSMERVRLLREDVKPYAFPANSNPVDAYLGLDIGSVGTKLVLIDDQGDVIHSIFTRTEGRPIEVVTRAMREMEEAVGWGVNVRAVGTTGSGRELIGELVGADAITDEITCHKTGAAFVGDRLLNRRPDTIFEIGGQDSKYISLEAEGTEARRHEDTQGAGDGGNGNRRPHAETESIVVDFTMNEACAAGTGSFLEERAEELGVSIRSEFAQLALSSKAPIKLGERCTVFMERDVNTCMQRGADRADVIAGLAYSIAYNYINRVVRGRRIGDCIFFQGGTAYNDAVAAAFSMITGKEIIVPPHNAVLGAIGAALLAREKIAATGMSTRFRGYDLQRVNYKLREFTCHGCGNQCSIQEFTVEGEKTFWGDKCSDRFRKQAKTERKPIIPDLTALRHQLMLADDPGEPIQGARTVGIPLAMYTWDLLPLWRRFFRDCGFNVVVSSETNRPTVRAGLEHVVAEPCFPIVVAHGHVAELVEQNVDYLWIPNITTAAERYPDVDSYVCPWGSTLPFIIRQAPAFRAWNGRILCPTLSLQRGHDVLRDNLTRTVADLGVSKRVARQAFDAAVNAQAAFQKAYADAGRAALDQLIASGESGMVLVGRPYNMHDAGVSLSTARKLRELYGVNVLPVDALPLAGVDIRDVSDNMYWAYGQKILAAAKLVAQHPNLHIIYITNFKCGPDSFLKGYIRPASGKPFLTLQFDGHSNDAGMMTRCEAYLDSKGILRWWRTCQTKPQQEVLPGEPSTSPRCPTPLPG
jgi:activator of 2-hydroxyglutaryl-CoA dehydratase/predicted nucleotide-binding protein (sugar kinase/HSP70/actin superfamily)